MESTQQQPPRLDTLPTELIQHIAVWLTPQSLVRIQQTCRTVHQAVMEPLAPKLQCYRTSGRSTLYGPAIAVDNGVVDLKLLSCWDQGEGRKLSLLLALSRNPYTCNFITQLKIYGPVPTQDSAAHIPCVHFPSLECLALKAVSFDTLQQLRELLDKHTTTLKRLTLDSVWIRRFRGRRSLLRDWRSFLHYLASTLKLEYLFITPPEHPLQTYKTKFINHFEDLDEWYPMWKSEQYYHGTHATAGHMSALGSSGAPTVLFRRDHNVDSKSSLQHFELQDDRLTATGPDAVLQALELCLSRYHPLRFELETTKRILRIGASRCLSGVFVMMGAPFVVLEETNRFIREKAIDFKRTRYVVDV